MSRHDPILAWLRENATATPFLAKVAEAFEEEIRAHDRTRENRNDATKRVRSLEGNVRGLESKITTLTAFWKGDAVAKRSLEVLQREVDDLRSRIAAARDVLDGRERDSVDPVDGEDRVSE